jgi:hypothetical protein
MEADEPREHELSERMHRSEVEGAGQRPEEAREQRESDLVTDLARALDVPEVETGTLQFAAQTAGALAAAVDTSEQVIFAGYTGALIERPKDSGRHWRVFYLDARLFRWMLVERDRVRLWRRIETPESPTGDCDYIWVDYDAPVASGSGPQSVEAPFLSGDFTRAGAFEAPSGGRGGGTSTGLFCDARTPSCCRKYTRS